MNGDIMEGVQAMPMALASSTENSREKAQKAHEGVGSSHFNILPATPHPHRTQKIEIHAFVFALFEFFRGNYAAPFPESFRGSSSPVFRG